MERETKVVTPDKLVYQKVRARRKRASRPTKPPQDYLRYGGDDGPDNITKPNSDLLQAFQPLDTD